MKKLHLVFAAVLFVLASCSGPDALSASEEIVGFWRLDSVVVFDDGERKRIDRDMDWTLRFENNQVKNCYGDHDDELRYTIKETEAGKADFAVHPQYGENVESKLEFADTDHFVLIQESSGGSAKKWYHTRITEAEFGKNCGQK